MTTRVIVALAAAALLAGCAGDGGEVSAPGDQPAPTTAGAASTSSDDRQTRPDPTTVTAEGTDMVALEIFQYRPRHVSVAPGTTVTWTNQDATEHTVTAGTPAQPQADRFNLPLDGEGASVTFSFEQPGTYRYFCEIHPFMRAAVTVE